MPTTDLADVKAHLPEIIAGLNPGEQLIIEQDGEPIATLTQMRSPAMTVQSWECQEYTTLDDPRF